MIITKALFWICLAIIFYTYIGYGLLLWIINLFLRLFSKSDNVFNLDFEPEVTLVVAAFNEEDCIEQKITNSLELNYPTEKLRLLFITDGSTDRSPEIIEKYSEIKLLHQSERLGKSAALNRAMKHVSTPIVVFCDANTLLSKEAISKIVKHYEDISIGGVAGEKKILLRGDAGIVGGAEGAYWKYESWMKRMDSEFYSIVGAAGELFSIRTELYEPIKNDVILDDFFISMHVALKGYRYIYEPEAYAVELPSANIKEERKRKIRICAGGFQAMSRLPQAFNIIKMPRLAFQFISHRVLRWTLAPICLAAVAIINLILVIINPTALYVLLFSIQIIFYMIACLGYFLSQKDIRMRIFSIPYYFTFMNLSVFLGFIRYRKGQQTVLWEKAQRERI